MNQLLQIGDRANVCTIEGIIVGMVRKMPVKDTNGIFFVDTSDEQAWEMNFGLPAGLILGLPMK